MEEPGVKTYAYLALPAIIWGGAWVAAKIIVAEIDPYVVGSIRFMTAFLILFPLVYVKEGQNGLPKREDFPIIIFQGTIGIFLYSTLYLKGLQLTSAIHGSLISASIPAVTSIFSALYLREKIGSSQVIGFVVSLAGVVVIISQGSWEVLQRIRFNLGDILISFSVICWALYSVGGKVAQQRLSPLAQTAYSSGVGAIMLTLWACPNYDFSRLLSISWQGIIAMVYLSVFSSALALVIWFTAIEIIGASKTSFFIYLTPVIATLLAMPILHERIKIYHLFGVILVLFGVYMANELHLRGKEKQVGLS